MALSSLFVLSMALAAVAAPLSWPLEPRDTLNDGNGAGDTATKGLLVQFMVLDDGTATAANNISTALTAAVPAIDDEAATLSWFGARVNNGNASDCFVVFDTFADDAGRAAHLGGAVAASLISQSPTFVNGLSIDPYDILAVKATDNGGSDVTLGLRILFTAQEDKISDVQQFCRDSLVLVQAEPGTVNWQCIQLPGTATFGILDSFPDQASRDAHLAGEVAKNLFAIVPTLLTGPPDVQQIDVIAATVKSAAPVSPASSTATITNSAKLGLLVPFTAQPDTAADVQSFVQGATPLAAAEPRTLQWFGASLQNITDNELIVFDTFATEEDREAHLGGQVAAGLLSQIGALSSLNVIPYDIFAIKSTNDDAAVASPTSGVTVGLRIFFNASSESTIPQVHQFCGDSLALINAEPGTKNWICGQIPNTQTFLILDSFDNEDSRNVHLQGKFAQSLFGIAGTLIDTPDVQMIQIFAGTSKPEDDGVSDPQSEAGATATTSVTSVSTTASSQGVPSTTSAAPVTDVPSL
ncbi:hypothetical protein EXIGLDRAFT_840226 [Exidia glandulosa HHB12029]|uniref:ABM domain-containing protein n=1 Tax=Exidia glandulosa HHB12029 TaxID=1314781 RepID=A0A165EJZ9_EXIGL|nr:hypothetical protein EXIGLDRAFT_840226 [Exidia glandulosa HHB12029]